MSARVSPGLALALSALLAIVAGGLFVLAGRSVTAQRWKDAEANLRAQVLLLEDGLAGDFEDAEPEELQARVRRLGQRTGIRVTLVRADGTVLADSEANPATMDNLGTRPEMLAALEQEFACVRRHSPTMNFDALFVAKAVRHGERVTGWIRASLASARVDPAVGASEWLLVATIAIATAGALALGTLGARLSSKRSREPAG